MSVFQLPTTLPNKVVEDSSDVLQPELQLNVLTILILQNERAHMIVPWKLVGCDFLIQSVLREAWYIEVRMSLNYFVVLTDLSQLKCCTKMLQKLTSSVSLLREDSNEILELEPQSEVMLEPISQN